MVLVDVAHAKQRHIPYRDSRLTFLLQVNKNNFFLRKNYLYSCYIILKIQYGMQDSLGGNSKTMIIANVSPSIWFVHMYFTLIYLFIRRCQNL